ncbi:MAG: CheR family methyltransferase [Bacillota bacterium]
MLHTESEILSDRDFHRISDVVYRYCGINLHEGKRELVRARIAKRLRCTGFERSADYLDQVLADEQGEEFTHLIDCLSTNLTSFYRESVHFDYLRERLLPELLDRKRRAGVNRIRAWSAGCSSGEEPYTLAIELLSNTNDAQGWDVRILATDISVRVLKMAQAGMYDAARVEAVPPLLRQKYLIPARRDGQTMYQVAPAAQRLIRFARLNLMETWPFSGPFDFIFCRNVMIYFDKPTQQTLVNRFWECLEKGGVLFTGHSESLTGIAHKFRYVQPTVYAKA